MCIINIIMLSSSGKKNTKQTLNTYRHQHSLVCLPGKYRDVPRPRDDLYSMIIRPGVYNNVIQPRTALKLLTVPLLPVYGDVTALFGTRPCNFPVDFCLCIMRTLHNTIYSTLREKPSAWDRLFGFPCNSVQEVLTSTCKHSK